MHKIKLTVIIALPSSIVGILVGWALTNSTQNVLLGVLIGLCAAAGIALTIIMVIGELTSGWQIYIPPTKHAHQWFEKQGFKISTTKSKGEEGE